MFAIHAKNYMEKEPALPPPVYAPELVAHSILYAAAHPKRDVFVGGASKAISSSGFAMPRVLDKVMNASMFRQQQSDAPSAPNRRDALYEPDPRKELRQRQGMEDRHVMEHCPYTAVSLRANRIVPALLGAGALFAAWKLARRPHLRGVF
jgi:hypothetical protein